MAYIRNGRVAAQRRPNGHRAANATRAHWEVGSARRCDHNSSHSMACSVGPLLLRYDRPRSGRARPSNLEETNHGNLLSRIRWPTTLTFRTDAKQQGHGRSGHELPEGHPNERAQPEGGPSARLDVDPGRLRPR